MTPQPVFKRASSLWGKLLLVVLVSAGIIASGRFSHLWSGAGLGFLFLGAGAMILAGFSWSEIRTGLRWLTGLSVPADQLALLPRFWEAAGRDFWLLGVLGTIINFILALSRMGEGEGGIQAIASGMALSFRPALYGMILAVACAVPAVKAREKMAERSEPAIPATPETEPGRRRAGLTGENFLGYILLLIVLAWSVSPSFGKWKIAPWPGNPFLDWASLLAVGGGAMLLFVFLGRGLAAESISAVFGVTGTVGALTGLLQTLFGIAHKNIAEVSSALTFVISSCFLALIGIVLIGAPREDRGRRDRDGRISAKRRLAWYAFPLLVLIFIMIVLILVVTPIKV